MTNWHDSPLMIVKSADPLKDDGASHHHVGYILKSVTECNGQIFVFLINEPELKRSKKRTARITSSRA